MPDFRVADTASEHPKMRAAGLAAAGLWSLAGSWCMNPAHLTDGWVPMHYVQTWPSGKKLATKLVEAGLWAEEKRNGQAGFRYHDWTDIQRSSSQIEAKKLADAVRRDLYGSPKLIAAIKARDCDLCRYCGRKVGWTNRRGDAGATFDHVLPVDQGGKSTLLNVVVACRGCSASKGSKTPEEAGMTLLPPPSKPDGDPDGTKSETKSGPRSEAKSGLMPEPGKNSAPHPHPHPKEVEETYEAAPVGDARARGGRGASGPHATAAAKLVRRVLGRDLTSGTLTLLTIEVATLAAEVDEPTLIEALERWNSRTEIGPKLLGALVDDIRKERRGATNRRHPTAPPGNATDAFAAQFLAGGQPQQPALRALPGGA